MATWKEALGRGEVLVMMKCKSVEAIACIFLKVEEMYPDQEKALTAFLKEMIFTSVHTKSISDPSSDLTKIRSVYKIGKKRTAAGFRKQYEGVKQLLR